MIDTYFNELKVLYYIYISKYFHNNFIYESQIENDCYILRSQNSNLYIYIFIYFLYDYI